MAVAMALFTRDLRLHDNPVLVAAASADEVIPVFVLDETIVRSRYFSPNKAAFLAASLHDLDENLRRAGGQLILRRGDPVREVERLVTQYGVDEVHIAEDVSSFSRRREHALAERLDRAGARLQVHSNSITVVAPGAVLPTGGGDYFAVFTPYFRRWSAARHRKPLGRPRMIRLPSGVSSEPLPDVAELTKQPVSEDIPAGGETAGCQVAKAWLTDHVDEYDERHDDLAGDATSRLSSYLHFGCVSPTQLVDRVDRSTTGGEAFVRQVAWRDFHHQMLAARPRIATEDFRPREDRWHRDQDALTAWRDGRTGFPIVDAGMRQLAAQGWMHNRARMITASFLTKTLYQDWRSGAAHFMDLLVDGDIANNQLNWQWVAGTGADTRPNRVLNPLRQASRYDPDGAYVRRWVPELAHIDGSAVHEPWTLTDDAAPGYPARIVDHEQAAREFKEHRST